MTQTDFPVNPRSASVSARLGRLQFHLSGKFRVLQVADIQEGPNVSKDTIRFLARACDDARPDLVIFTGNQIKGYDPSFGTTYQPRRWTDALVGSLTPLKAGTENAYQTAHPHDYVRRLVYQQAQQFLAPLIARGIPFAITYGNHDFQCGLTTTELDDIYRSFPGCLNPGRPANSTRSGVISGGEPGTFALPVWDLPSDTDQHVNIRRARALEYPQAARRQRWSKEQSERPVMTLVLLNSGDYSRQGGYGSPSHASLTWLANLEHNPLYAHTHVYPTVFQHFPLPQYYSLLMPVPSYRDGAIEGYRTYAHACYILHPQRVLPGSRLGEGISCPDHDCGEYAILTRLHASAVLTGHDHRNAFAGRLADDEPLLCATPTSGFGSYGPPAAERAVRLVEYDIRHPTKPRTKLLTFGGLVGTTHNRSVYTFASDHVPVNASQTRDMLRKPSVLAGLAGAGAVCIAIASFVHSTLHKFFTPSPHQS
jgi:3',5'-cyclic AMP phosphodiesterase CpdA